MTEKLRVTAEETICGVSDANNGAGPLWCYGSRTIAREGGVVFATVPEVSPDVKPLCNTRWVLWRRADGGAWNRAQAGAAFDEREPCPIARLPGGRLVVSTNAAARVRGTLDDGRLAHDCEPRLQVFDAAAPERGPAAVAPEWGAAYGFTEHSYRALATDGVGGGVFVTNQVYAEGEWRHAWGFYDADLKPVRQGLLRFPMRGCYQQIAVRGRAAYVMAVSDEEEPNLAWRAHKQAVTGKAWDYDFRQLFFTWTPDLASRDFSPVLTVASRDETAGLIINLDLWVDAEGGAHLLYLERNVWHAFMRKRFFPGLPITVALKYARVCNGRVVERRVLVEAEEDVAARGAGDGGGDGWEKPGVPMRGAVPTYGTFHADAGGRLWVVWSQAAGAGEAEGAGMLARVVWPEAGEAAALAVQKPLTRFYAAGERNGCLPSNAMDLCGLPADGSEMRYVRVDVLPPGCEDTGAPAERATMEGGGRGS